MSLMQFLDLVNSDFSRFEIHIFISLKYHLPWLIIIRFLLAE
jgi:hypothetical protein